MKNIAIFYGGKSVEHDISILTACQVYNAIDKIKYKIFPIYIDKSGNFYLMKNIDLKNHQTEKFSYKYQITFMAGKAKILKKTLTGYVFAFKIDVALLCNHGSNVEDGTLQGFLKTCDITYTSPNVISSAVGMDKVFMKDIFKANDINTVPYLSFDMFEMKTEKSSIIEKTEKYLSYPVIVKPATLGSSIGITKAKTKKQLEKALQIAFMFDHKVIVEKCLENMREINCAVLGSKENYELSILEEPQNFKDFLNFEDKYVQNRKSFCSTDVILSEETKNEIYAYSKKIFKIFGLSGIIRIDYMISNDNRVFANEFNTIPGSLSNYLFKDRYNFNELIDKIISIAEIEKTKENEKIYIFNSSVLKDNKNSSKLTKK